MKSVHDVWNSAGSAYDWSRLDCGIAHLGVGNFVRAHLAVFLNAYLQTHPEDWMIHGIGLREADSDLIEAMHRQNNLYTLIERSGSRDTFKGVGSIKECSFAPGNEQRVIHLLASPMIKIVSLTITEKGYYYDAAGDLDVDHPDI